MMYLKGTFEIIFSVVAARSLLLLENTVQNCVVLRLVEGFIFVTFLHFNFNFNLSFLIIIMIVIVAMIHFVGGFVFRGVEWVCLFGFCRLYF